ncbi:Cysteine desulfurase [Caloramator mitchellensis]|uniref:Cysteine desulfurase n=2 Tax=Caloramator mitchellensis TaxID=908809 RepID=A0A0R3K299_CALMK|nr:Cysteine desulfurase [Caloramator mitchellensis]
MIYFDNSATTKPYKEVVDEVMDCLTNYFGNPSSAHRLGIEAEKKLSSARERVARIINAGPNEIFFTSGGTEANNTVIKGLLKKGDHVITTKIEHKSVIQAVKQLEEDGIEATYLSVDKDGIINLDELKNSIKDNTRLVTIMYVNNEIGSIQPVEDIIKIVREKSKKAKIHFDAVQALGKIKIDVKKLDADFLSLSAHKIHGPKGVGALYVKKDLKLKSLLTGGGQEKDLRSGTENVPGISGFGVACDFAYNNIEKNIEKVKEIKMHFIKRLSEIDDCIVNSPFDDKHINNVLSVSFLGVRGEVLLHGLEDYKIYVSTGSACSAKKAGHKNYVLPEIGLNEDAIEGTIRFSFSHMNEIQEVDKTIDALKNLLKFLRRFKR